MGRRLSDLLLALGACALLAAALVGAAAALDSWLTGEAQFLSTAGVAAFPVRDVALPISARDDPTPGPAAPTAADLLAPAPARAAADLLAPPPAPTATPRWVPSPEADWPTPAYIRIPAIGVNRSVVELPLTQDSATGAWVRDATTLFRSRGKDLVGHWEGSAQPGQAGNMILIGHNYGYGYTGVFVRLGRLKAGATIEVVDSADQVHTYRVTTVKRVRWARQDAAELAEHLPFLALGGPERLTLVTCAGANVEPFPERLYVVAEPQP